MLKSIQIHRSNAGLGLAVCSIITTERPRDGLEPCEGVVVVVAMEVFGDAVFCFHDVRVDHPAVRIDGARVFHLFDFVGHLGILGCCEGEIDGIAEGVPRSVLGFGGIGTGICNVGILPTCFEKQRVLCCFYSKRGQVIFSVGFPCLSFGGCECNNPHRPSGPLI